MEKYKALGMNIELTTECPLRCPQCYCSLEGGKHIPLPVVSKYMKQAKDLGIKHVELSGGETLCYPFIFDVIKCAKENNLVPNVALSGFAFTQTVYEKLIDAGVGGIYISLNGSTEEINARTRDGYGLAMAALSILQRNQYPDATINWVMHSSNAEDFPNMILLAEKYHVANLAIIGVKPDSKHMLPTLPSAEQLLEVSNTIRSYRGKVRIIIESCFSPLLALVSQTKLLGNINVGLGKGCGAGRTVLNVNVDGMLSPCRHLDYFERWDCLKDYWEHSSLLKKIRTLEENKQEPCKSCFFSNYCRHCLSINDKLMGELYIGNEFCPLATYSIR